MIMHEKGQIFYLPDSFGIIKLPLYSVNAEQLFI